jgi:hypothetical protein
MDWVTKRLGFSFADSFECHFRAGSIKRKQARAHPPVRGSAPSASSTRSMPAMRSRDASIGRGRSPRCRIRRLATEPIRSAPTARGASVSVPDASRELVDGLDCANSQRWHWRNRKRYAGDGEKQRLAQMTSGASSPSPQRQGRMMVGMFPPSANHSLQLCSRKPSCS